MGAPGLEPAGDQARHRRAVVAAVAFEHLPMGDRRAGARAHRHLVAGAGMAADRLVDGAARPLRRAPHERQAAAAQRPAAAVGGELAGGGRGGAAARARWARSVFATTIRPLVSLSRRCTMPGRLTPPTPDRLSPQWATSALTRVPLQLPAAGWTTSPAGLSMTMRSASSNTTSSGMDSGATATSSAGGRARPLVAPALTRGAG